MRFMPPPLPATPANATSSLTALHPARRTHLTLRKNNKRLIPQKCRPDFPSQQTAQIGEISRLHSKPPVAGSMSEIAR